MVVHLVSQSGKDVTPLLNAQISQTESAGVSEMTYAWVLEPNRVYYLETQHHKQMSRKEKNKCVYFDVFISVSTLDYLSKQLSCASK